MTRLEHLLTIGAEECAEIAQRLSKSLRFGLDEIEPGQFLSNRQRVIEEVNDLLAALSMADLVRTDGQAIAAKVTKIEKYLTYSAQQGTLT